MVRSGPERAGRGLTWTAILPALNPLAIQVGLITTS